MLVAPECYIRKCKNYLGVLQPDGTEMTETNYCSAYPESIPADIAYGKDKHLKVRDDQDNKFVFEEDPDWGA
jgi:hypothetical protein